MKIFDNLFTLLFLSSNALFEHFTFFLPILFMLLQSNYICIIRTIRLIDVFITFDLNLYNCSKFIWIMVIITGCKN